MFLFLAKQSDDVRCATQTVIGHIGDTGSDWLDYTASLLVAVVCVGSPACWIVSTSHTAAVTGLASTRAKNRSKLWTASASLMPGTSYRKTSGCALSQNLDHGPNVTFPISCHFAPDGHRSYRAECLLNERKMRSILRVFGHCFGGFDNFSPSLYLYDSILNAVLVLAVQIWRLIILLSKLVYQTKSNRKRKADESA